MESRVIRLTGSTTSGWHTGMIITFESDGGICIDNYREGPGGGASSMYLDEYIDRAYDSCSRLEDLLKLFDDLVKEGKITYKEIYDYIKLNPSRNSKNYTAIAVYCAEKEGISWKEAVKETTVFSPWFSCKEFETNYWNDENGEVLEVKKLDFIKNIRWGYIKLPILDEKPVKEYCEVCKSKGIQIDKDLIDNYVIRCEILGERLLWRFGISRDHERHKYVDAQGREVQVIKPDFYNKNDKGSFSYVDEPIHNIHTKGRDDGNERD